MGGHGPKLTALCSLTLAAALAVGCGEGAEQDRRAAPAGLSEAQKPKAPGSQRSARRPKESISITDLSPGESESSGFLSPPGEGTSGIASTGVAALSFDVAKPSRLAWTNTGDKPFAARGSGVSIDSAKGRGEVDLDAGAYRNFYVSGASWRIVIRPR